MANLAGFLAFGALSYLSGQSDVYAYRIMVGDRIGIGSVMYFGPRATGNQRRGNEYKIEVFLILG